MPTSNPNPGCLAALFGLFNKSRSGDDISTRTENSAEENEPLPCRVRDDFLTPAELSFYQVLPQLSTLPGSAHLPASKIMRIAEKSLNHEEHEGHEENLKKRKAGKEARITNLIPFFLLPLCTLCPSWFNPA